MNSIYKIVFNKATGTYQAVAEFAKSHTRAGSGVVGSKSRSILAALPLSLLALSVGEAMAMNNDLDKYIKISTSGQVMDASATNDKAIAVGTNAKANAPNTVVIGADATAGEQHSAVIIGKGAKSGKFGNENYVHHYHYENPLSTYPVVLNSVLGKILTSSTTSQQAVESSVVAIGTDTEAKGGGVAVGHGAISTVGSGNRGLGVAVGAASRSIDGGVAVGPGAESVGLNTVAVGRQAVAKGKASQAHGATSAAEGVKTIAMGQSAHAKGDRSIAIGASGGESTEKYDGATNTMAEAEDSIAFGTHARTGQGANKAIAIGKNAEVARNAISGVAIGDTAKTSKTNAIALGNTAKAEGVTSTAIGTTAKASRFGAQAIGFVATADGIGSQAIGAHAIAKGLHTQAIGADARALAANATAVGHLASAKGESAAAFGHMAKADKQHATATGAFAKAQAKDATALGAHAQVTKMANHGSALGAFSRVTKKDGVALGAHSLADRQHLTGVQVAAVAKADANQVYSPLLVTTIENTKLVGALDGATQAKLKAFNEGIKNTVKGKYGAVSVGDKNNTRQIINVAAGSEDSDAVNVAQLKALAGTPIIFEADQNGKVIVNLGDRLPVKGKENGGIITKADLESNGLTIEVKPNTNKGISIDEHGVGINVNRQGPLTVDNQGLNLKIDGDLLEITGAEGDKKLSAKAPKFFADAGSATEKARAVEFDGEKNTLGVVGGQTIVGDQLNQNGKNIVTKIDKTNNKIEVALKTDVTNLTSLQFADGKGIKIGDANTQATYSDSLALGRGAKAEYNLGAIAIGTNAATSYITRNKMHGNVYHANYENPYSEFNFGKTPPSFNYRVTDEKKRTPKGVNERNQIGSAAIAIGRNSKGENGGVALGDGAQTLVDRHRGLGVAIGAYALSRGGGVVIGSSAEAVGINSVAFGRQAVAKGGSAQAYGAASSAVGEKSLALGHSAESIGARSITIGGSSGNSVEKYDAETNTKAVADDSIAIGPMARTTADARWAMALGVESRAEKAGSVALGSESVADRTSIDQAQVKTVNHQIADTGNNQVYTPLPNDAQTNPATQLFNQAIRHTIKGNKGAVSVGNGTNTRQITNVAAGSTDTDAVNVAQLRALANLPLAFEADELGQVERKMGERLPVKGATNGGIITKADLATNGLTIEVKPNMAKGIKVDGDGVGINLKPGDNLLSFDNDALVVNPQNVVEQAQLPVVYTDKQGNKLTKVGDEFYQLLDNGQRARDKTPKDQVIASLNNGANNTKQAPMTLANVQSSINLKQPLGNGPRVTADKPADFDTIKNNAATVEDVVNAGFNLKNNNQARDFVQAFDTLNVVDGKGTMAIVTNEDGKVSTIKVDVKAKHNGGLSIDDLGVSVDVDNKTIQLTTDGKVAAKTTELQPNQTGKIDTPADGEALVTAKTVADAINNSGFTLETSHAGTGQSAGASELIKAGEKVTLEAGDNISVTQAGGKVRITTTDDVVFNNVTAKQGVVVGDTTDGRQAIRVTSTGNAGREQNHISGLTHTLPTIGNNNLNQSLDESLDISSDKADPSKLSRAATVADALSTGFNLQANGEAKDFIRAYDTIDFVDGDFSKVDIKNDTNSNKSTIKLNINAQGIVENAQLPVVYTDKKGNKLVKEGGKFYQVNPLKGGKTAIEVEPNEVIASMNNGNGETKQAPMTLANVAHNITVKPTIDDKPAFHSDKPKNADAIQNNAATVGDVLNVGFNLKERGVGKDFVQAFDTLDIIDGNGTTARVNTDEDRQSSTITFDVKPNRQKGVMVDADGVGINIDDNAGLEFKQAADNSASKLAVKADGTTIKVEGNAVKANTTDLTVNTDISNIDADDLGEVKLAKEDQGNALVTAKTVADAINNSGFVLTVDKADDESGEVESDEPFLVSSGEKLGLKAGKNIKLTQQGGQVTFATKDDLDLTTAVFTDQGGNKTGVGGSGVFIVPNGVDPETQPNDIVTLTVNGLNNGGNSITNVKSNLADNDIATEVPAQNRKDSLAGKVNNAATVGDVLNAGWNLQNNGQPVDVISHADSVNFINGRGTTVVTDNDPATGTTTIKVDSPIAYVGGNEADATDTATPSNTVKLYGKDNSPVQVTNIASGVRGKVTPTGDNGSQTAKDVANAIKTATGDTLNNAVNVGDLKDTINDTITTVSTDAYGLKDKAGNEFKQSLGTTAQITGDDNINTEVVEVTSQDGTKGHALKVSLNPTLEIGAKDGKDGKDGVDGKLGINGKDGSAIVLNGKDGSIGLNGKDGKDGLTFKAADGAQGVDGKDGANGLPGKNGQTRIVYETKDKDGGTKTEEVANLNDGLIFTGNNGELNRHKLNSVVKIIGEGVDATESGRFESATGNINVKANGTDALEIQLSKDIDLTKGGSITIGDTVLTDNGLTIDNGPSVTKDGINAGGKKVTNVEAGTEEGDAVNVKQLKDARTTVTSSDNSISVENLNQGQDGKNLAYDIKVNSQSVVENAQLPVVYTDVYGNKLYKQPDGTFIDKDGNKVDPADVIASINNGKGSTTQPTNLANVAGNLTPTYNVGDMIVGPNGRLTTNPIFDATKEQAAPQGQDLANMYNNAATVGDVLNAGFNLQANGQAADFVKAYDTVNFANGTGTTVVVDNTDGKTSTIKVDVNVDDETITTKQDPNDPAKTVIAAKTTKLNTNPQGGNEAGKVTVEGDQGNALVTAKTVADAINNSGFTLQANGQDGKLVKAGDTISINQGDNINVTQDENGNLTVATKKDVAFETVKVGDTLQVDNLLKVGDINITPEGINAGNKKVTNVADGNISEGSKDAVNGGQIHQLKADLTKGINAAKTEVEGTGFAKVTSKRGDQGQTIYTVDVAKAAPATVDAKGNLSIAETDGDKVLSAADTINAINNSGFTLKANGQDGKLVKAGDTISINQGDNITVTQDENGNLTVATKQDVAFETVKVGDTLKVGDVIINQDGINAGNQKVTNVADGNISEGSKDAVNGGQIHQLKADLTKGINAAKTEVKAGNNVSIDSTKGAQGQDIYTINAKDRSAKVVAKAQGLIAVEQGETTSIDGADTTSFAVDLTQAAKDDIAKGVKALDKVDNQGLTFNTDNGATNPQKLGSTLNVKGDKNITTQAQGDTVEVKLSDDIAVNSITTGDSKLDTTGLTINAATPANTISLTAQGLNNGGQRITNVAPGVDMTDAVNVGQLMGATNHLSGRIDDVANQSNAGVSSAMAMAALPQAYIPGKSMLTGGIASYNGEGAVAVGFSKLSDNGRWVLKVSGSADTKGKAGGSVGAGFHF
ncbi:YadA-like family protein [Moraxella bovoculi]|uniref:YadA-like family protein n=1 Tax=Moraxella bovoculi TaxID=386891 RepID=UPI003F4FF0CB